MSPAGSFLPGMICYLRIPIRDAVKLRIHKIFPVLIDDAEFIPQANDGITVGIEAPTKGNVFTGVQIVELSRNHFFAGPIQETDFSFIIGKPNAIACNVRAQFGILGIDQILPVFIDQAVFTSDFYHRYPVSEVISPVKLRIDDIRSGLIDIAPLVSQLYRCQAVIGKRISNIELRIYRIAAGLINITVLIRTFNDC